MRGDQTGYRKGAGTKYRATFKKTVTIERDSHIDDNVWVTKYKFATIMYERERMEEDPALKLFSSIYASLAVKRRTGGATRLFRQRTGDATARNTAMKSTRQKLMATQMTQVHSSFSTSLL